MHGLAFACEHYGLSTIICSIFLPPNVSSSSWFSGLHELFAISFWECNVLSSNFLAWCFIPHACIPWFLISYCIFTTSATERGQGERFATRLISTFRNFCCTRGSPLLGINNPPSFRLRRLHRFRNHIYREKSRNRFHYDHYRLAPFGSLFFSSPYNSVGSLFKGSE